MIIAYSSDVLSANKFCTANLEIESTQHREPLLLASHKRKDKWEGGIPWDEDMRYLLG